MAEGAFFNPETIDAVRKLNLPEYEAAKGRSKEAYYVLSADVGRHGDLTEVTAIKVTPNPSGIDSAPLKCIVNIYSFEDMHFGQQALKLKKLYYRYKARRLVVDGTGLGTGLIDFLVKPSLDEETGESYPGFGVFNDENKEYKRFETVDTEPEALYIIKANAGINSEMHANVQTQLNTRKMRLLIDEKTALQKLADTKVGQKMTPDQRNEYLLPFVQTSLLKTQMLNLKEVSEGSNIVLKKVQTKFKKDKFSSLELGLYYIKKEEESKKKKRKKFNAFDWNFFN